MAGKHYFHRNSFDPVPKYDFCMLIPEVHITHFAQSCPVCVVKKLGTKYYTSAVNVKFNTCKIVQILVYFVQPQLTQHHGYNM